MYPKDVAKFIAWSKAMVAGATVNNPNYGKSGVRRTTRSRTRRTRGGHPRHRRFRHAKKTED